MKEFIKNKLGVPENWDKHDYQLARYSFEDIEEVLLAYEEEQLRLGVVINWVAFDFYKLETRPPKYGKYLITRKDGKIHWETWNGSGWAYNHNEIICWAEIKPPCL